MFWKNGLARLRLAAIFVIKTPKIDQNKLVPKIPSKFDTAGATLALFYKGQPTQTETGMHASEKSWAHKQKRKITNKKRKMLGNDVKR